MKLTTTIVSFLIATSLYPSAILITPATAWDTKTVDELQRFLVDDPHLINARDNEGFTLLHRAAQKGRDELVQYLLDQGSDIHAQTEDVKDTALHWASHNGYVGTARLLLNRGAKLEGTNKWSWTPLHTAAGKGQTEIIHLLLAYGANVHAKTDDEETPLHWASNKGSLNAVQLLLSHGARVDEATQEKETVLHLAVSENNIEISRLLLNQGAKVNAQTKEGNTPLHWASHHGYVDTAELLLACHATLHALNKEQWTPLHYASCQGNTDMVQLLLDHGANVHAQTTTGDTPLHLAAHESVAELLIRHGADANTRNQDGETPLHSAAEKPSKELIELLLNARADTQARSKKGKTPLHHTTDCVYIARLLLDHGADLGASDQRGWTPLHTAAYEGNEETIQLFLRRGADIQARREPSGLTALQIAAIACNRSNVHTLIEAGSNMKVKTVEGASLLDLVAQELSHSQIALPADQSLQSSFDKQNRASKTALVLIHAGATKMSRDTRILLEVLGNPELKKQLARKGRIKRAAKQRLNRLIG